MPNTVRNPNYIQLFSDIFCFCGKSTLTQFLLTDALYKLTKAKATGKGI